MPHKTAIDWGAMVDGTHFECQAYFHGTLPGNAIQMDHAGKCAYMHEVHQLYRDKTFFENVRDDIVNAPSNIATAVTNLPNAIVEQAPPTHNCHRLKKRA